MQRERARQFIPEIRKVALPAPLYHGARERETTRDRDKKRGKKRITRGAYIMLGEYRAFAESLVICTANNALFVEQVTSYV